jgi:hypothetical protein
LTARTLKERHRWGCVAVVLLALPITLSLGASATAAGLKQPTVSVVASPDVEIGGSVHGTATLAGGSRPTGVITFNLYGPDNPACSGTPAFTATQAISGNGSYDSGAFTPTQIGTYRWTASYGGDKRNRPAQSACDAAEASVSVTAAPQASPTLSSEAFLDVPVGEPIVDVATLANGSSPGGTITFQLYGPDDASCSGLPGFTTTTSVSGNGNYASASFTPTQVGTYRWTASYGGDANNKAAQSACDAPESSVTVSAAAAGAATIVPGFQSEDDPGSPYIGDMGGQAVRIHKAWCNINPGNTAPGSYNKTAVQDVINQVGLAHNHTPSYAPLINFTTGAPNYAKAGTASCGSRPAIGAGHEGDYGNAAQKLMFCLKRVYSADGSKCPWNDLSYPVGAGRAGVGVMGWVLGIELGNETNSATFWCKSVDANGICTNTITVDDANSYALALRDATTKIHNFSPSLPVSSGGISYGAPDGNPWGSHAVDGTTYLKQVLSQPHVDLNAVAIHPYGAGLHPDWVPVEANPYSGLNENVLDGSAAARQALNDFGYVGTPIWITEIGVDADCNNDGSDKPCNKDSPGGDKNVTAAEEQRQRDDLLTTWESVKYACTFYNVQVAMYWELVDDQSYGGTAKYYAGFLARHPSGPPYFGSPDPSKQAYQAFSQGGILTQNACH